MHHFIGGQAKTTRASCLGWSRIIGSGLCFDLFSAKCVTERTAAAAAAVSAAQKKASRPHCVNIGAVVIQESAILWVHHPSKMDVALRVSLWV